MPFNVDLTTSASECTYIFISTQIFDDNICQKKKEFVDMTNVTAAKV